MAEPVRIEQPSRFWSRAGTAILIIGTINSLLLAALIVIIFIKRDWLPAGMHAWLREFWAELLLVYLFFEVWQPLVRSVTSIVWVTIDYLASATVLIAYGVVLLSAVLFEGVTLDWRMMFGLTITVAIDVVLLTALGYLLSRRLIGGAVGVATY